MFRRVLILRFDLGTVYFSRWSETFEKQTPAGLQKSVRYLEVSEIWRLSQNWKIFMWFCLSYSF